MKKRRVRKIGKRYKHFIKLVAITGIVFTGSFLVWVSSLPIPDFDNFYERKVAESSKIYDRTGEILLFDVFRDIKRKVIPFDDISRHIKNATVAIEDSEYYDHSGLKPKAILRAFFVNLSTGDTTQGGSTITQQVIKNALLSKEKKISRKIKEAVLAIKLEKVMSKEEILSLYLNESPYGGSVYGVEEASQTFFGKSSSDVTLAEAAYLASLPKAPTYYSPYGLNIEDLERRKDIVLDRMTELAFISEEEKISAINETVVFLPQSEGGIKAPHFVMFVIKELRERYGDDVIEQNGLRVITTVDWDMQKKAEEIVARFAKSNTENYNATNAGLVAIDPGSGEILTMVGSKDYFDRENDGNFNIALAHRQPGSAFKPFVYATAFSKGYTPDTVVFDLETQFSTSCDKDGKPLPGSKPDSCYTPGNYDNIFRGPITLREALAQSVNVPSVKTLYLAGVSKSIETAKTLGVTGLSDPGRYGLTLVLGGGEVRLLDMTSAYGVFANDGIRNPYVSILSIEDSKGNTIHEFTHSPSRVLNENVARLINDVLSDNTARSPAFGTNSPLYFSDRDVAAKTGTTNDFRDAWIIGYTPNLVVGTWAGNNDNSPMEKKIAGFVVAPMWRAFLNEIFSNLPKKAFVPPEKQFEDELIKPVFRGIWRGGEQIFIDKISGKLATEHTPEETREELIIPSVHSILYWVNKDKPHGEKPPNPLADSQFDLWEPVVRDWATKQQIVEGGIDIPTEFDDIHTPDKAPRVSITSPNGNNVFSSDENITVTVSVDSTNPIKQADYFLNSIYIGSSNRHPYVFSFIPSTVSSIQYKNDLSVVVYDEVKNKATAKTVLNLSI